jgi:ribosomal protein L37AE/L43A
MTLAQALLTEAATVGLTIRRRGTRLALVAPTPPPADLVERLRQAKPDLLAALPDEDDPADPPFIAPDGTDDDAEERAAILEYDAHLPRHEAERLAGVLPAADGPHEPCPKCGGRNFWRPSMTTKAWRCRQCVPPLPTIWADGVFLPPAATTKGHQNVRS